MREPFAKKIDGTLAAAIRTITEETGRPLVVADCTASIKIGQALAEMADLNCCIVLANKKPLTSSFVGAALPVIATLNRLLNSGDSIKKIVSALSGTLGFVMSRLEYGESFSDIVRQAKELGYTEPEHALTPNIVGCSRHCTMDRDWNKTDKGENVGDRFLHSEMSSQRMFIERLRRELFGIGQSGPNPLALMLQETIRLLSAELYQKDIHFLSELLQNAEDNTYHSSVEPSIEIYLTKTDVTGTGAAATLLLLNNEVGFSEKNIESLCAAGQSTKKGKKSQGYIGEKGIGFKSVFLVTKQPYIINNGFRIRFNEEPHNEAKLGYIVPEWVDCPTDAVLQKEKISEVAKQLTQIPAETLLFLSKIRMLSIYDQQSRPPTELVLSRSVEMTTSKNGSVETSTTFLTASNGRNGTQHSNYYMFKQTLKVPEEAKVEKRKDVDSWMITLAFPVDDRISSSCSIGDIFSFLPSDIHSGLPFLINSDFLLVSSRATLLFDSSWNQGIFRCVPEVFYNAFELLLNTTAFGLQSILSVARMAMYKYVPVNVCRNSYLERVRNDILSKLKDNNVILCASDVGRAPPSGQLCKPALARKIAPSFRELLKAAPKCPRFLRGSPSYIVDSTLQESYVSVLRLLGVPDMSNDEYHQSLDSEDWMRSLPDDAYVKLLVFLSSKSSTLRSLKFLKYRGSDGRLQLASMDDLARNDGRSIYWDSGHRATAWLAGWTEVFQRWLTFNFVPSACAAKIRQHSVLENWLERTPFSVSELTACSLARQVLRAVTANSSDAKLAVLAMHFLFDLYRNDRSSYTSISNQKRNVPIVENDGAVSPYGASYVSTRPLLLPAACGAKWPLLLPSDVWRRGVRKLSEEYMESATVDLSDPDVRTEFVNFLKEQFLATDIPAFDPVNEALPPHYVGNVAASSLLLKWIKSRHCNAPAFASSIKNTKWLKTRHGYCCPTVAFLPVQELLKVLKVEDVPCVPSIPACEKNAATVKLLPPAKTVMVDQLELERLFGNTNPRPWVAWYPASQEINTQELYKVYSWLGVKTISECAESETNTSCMSLSLGRKLELLRLKEVELETSLKVHWTLRVGDTTRHAVSERMLYWNRERQELAYVDEGQRKKRNTEFGTEFARIIAEGLLFHHRYLIPGMERHLSMLAFSKFDVMEVDNMLIKHNMRLYSEDETFLKTRVIVDPSKADAEKNLHGGEAVAEMEPFVLPDVPETEEDQLERDSSISKPPADSRPTTIVVASSSYSPAFVAATPRPPPLDNRKYLLEQAFQMISVWRETYLPTVRRLLDYPPEEGYLKPGMRTGISLDKMLIAAFLDFPGVKGSSHHHLSVVGAACLNLCLAMELVKLDDNHHAGVNGGYKLTNTSLLAACFHACGLDESVLRSSNSAAVSDLVAASVARALLAVGFCAYDDGLGEVRRIYQEVFLAALGDDLG
ncbi:hypothetical protein SELMODRAFT_411714 [Selaginella moellendorffii]|uniref:homoserine dehydrogenase n=1 Tax=Selaginella moellendorffii TaxID=88036 RepID=D8RIT4_SELML|nr:hypothetical protein SELMODRAFT_411714 [Selaginella moellendorffii]